jgi:hypothetical protein
LQEVNVHTDLSHLDHRRWHSSVAVSSLLVEMTVILTIIWWLQRLERERLSVSKQAAQKFDMGRFNLKNTNDVEVKE